VIELYNKIVEKRGIFCEYCHARKGTTLHHCLYHRKKGAAFLDCEENLELLCSECHSKGVVNSFEHRIDFYNVQCQRYGKEHMENWNNSLPLKVKYRFS